MVQPVTSIPLDEEWSLGSFLSKTQSHPGANAGWLGDSGGLCKDPSTLRAYFSLSFTLKFFSTLLTETLSTSATVLCVGVFNFESRLLQGVVIGQGALHKVEGGFVVHEHLETILVGLNRVIFLGHVPPKCISETTTASSYYLNPKTLYF